jgi:ankyrin repeat protein
LKRGAVYDSKDRSFKTNDWFKLIREWMFDEKPLKFSVEEVAKDPDKLTIIKKARDYSGKTPLHTNENYFRVKYLIGQEVDFTLPDHEGDTPLHAAVKRGDMDIAKLFLDRGANVNAKNKNNSTPLHMAALSGHFHVTQLLLDYKSDFNTVDKKGRTPLDLAKEKFSQDPENHNLKKITDLIFRVVK